MRDIRERWVTVQQDIINKAMNAGVVVSLDTYKTHKVTFIQPFIAVTLTGGGESQVLFQIFQISIYSSAHLPDPETLCEGLLPIITTIPAIEPATTTSATEAATIISIATILIVACKIHKEFMDEKRLWMSAQHSHECSLQYATFIITRKVRVSMKVCVACP